MKRGDVLSWDAIYLVILSVFPYGPAILYALEQEGWELSGFSDFSWFNGGDYEVVREGEFHDWLSLRRD